MRLLVQPDAGSAPIVKAIEEARDTVEIVIFRFDAHAIETALEDAIRHGVKIHALIAYTNKGDGEKGLRELEKRLIAAGATVSRTADDLVRYHDKFLIIDRRELHLFAFNYTRLDIDRSRSFGITTTDKKLVAEAAKLFDADSKHEPYTPEHPDFVVSPLNARAILAAFIQAAERQLIVYDPKVADPAMIHLLEDRAKAGVDVRIIGRVTRRSAGLKIRELIGLRLHTRTIIADGEIAFVGSQSLRALELDSRREAGIIVRDKEIVEEIAAIFERDWKTAQTPRAIEANGVFPAAKVAKKTAKAVARNLPPVAPVVEEIVKEVAGQQVPVNLDVEELEETVKHAVRDAVREAIEQAVEGEDRP